MWQNFGVKSPLHAGVAELADAYASGAYGSNLVKVQVLSPAPYVTKTSGQPEVFYYGCSAGNRGNYRRK